MGKTRNQWCGPEALDTEAVRSEGTAVFLSREEGLSELMLHCWRDLVIKGGRERLKGGASSERVEIENLKMEIAGRECVIGEWVIVLRL